MRLPLSRGVLALLILAVSPGSCSFAPPQVFKNVNLLRTFDLTRPYVKETTAVIVENVSQEPQSDYFIPFPKDSVPKVSWIGARDKKGGLGDFEIKLVEPSLNDDDSSANVYYHITFPKPLQPSKSYTIQIIAILTSALSPVPAEIAQNEEQFLRYSSPKYALSAYPVEKQKTKFRFPSPDIDSFTKFPDSPDGTEDPQKLGNSLTYGPYSSISKDAGVKDIVLRYDFTQPIVHANKLQRDIEVSHWGGNLATEEKYWITNAGAKLKDHFSRVTWTSRSYYNSPSAALKQLTFPLQQGSSDVYYTDEIGNVTTSHFRSNAREAHLELKPRFPLMGGWNYSFTIGWNNDLGRYLKQKDTGGDIYFLKVPFMQGPTDTISYDEVEIRVILPEGAINIAISYPDEIHVDETHYLHKSYMDTIGRPTVVLRTQNLVDEVAKGKDIIVSYTYPKSALLRKPLMVATGVGALFVAIFLLGRVDVRIGK